MRGTAMAPNSPREAGVGVTMLRDIQREIASKSNVKQTVPRGMSVLLS
jgi:hypothetical protein